MQNRPGIDISNDADRCIFEEIDTENNIAEIENLTTDK